MRIEDWLGSDLIRLDPIGSAKEQALTLLKIEQVQCTHLRNPNFPLVVSLKSGVFAFSGVKSRSGVDTLHGLVNVGGGTGRRRNSRESRGAASQGGQHEGYGRKLHFQLY